jgi:molybdopterin molybdotransferase
MAERRLAEKHARGAFTVWQLGGAGAVGSQAMTGMAALSRLRARLGNAVRVWPFEDAEAAPVVLAEVWPSLIRAEIAGARHAGEIADAAQVRVLATALARLQAAGGLEAALAAAPAEARREEGWILGLGAETALRAAAHAALAAGSAGDNGAPATHGPAAQAASQPAAPGIGLVPPRLRDDCFALPRGVEWMPVDTALARLCGALVPVAGVETVPVTAADGRVLAEPVHALRANPPVANAAVDGYALAQGGAGGGVRRLPLLPGRAAAGHPFPGAVPEGHALRILTGAPLPEGVDTVVLEEDCATDGATVAFEGPLRAGANTRPAGEDFAAGAALLPAGHRLRPPDLALLAAAGLGAVAVRRPLRVAVLSTGDEVSDAWGAPLPPHRIHDANRPMLMALVRRWGHAAVDLGHAPDEAGAITARLDAGAAGADLILTSGGASAGEEDHVSRMLRDSGRLVSWRIAMKPGRPLALALWKGVPVMGLPGNPVAAFVCALVFARPALARLSGETWAGPLALTVPAAFTKRKKAGRREYLRARLTPAGEAEVFRSEGSGRISGLSWAEGLVELPDGALEVVPGTPVRFLPYAGFGL